MAEIKIYTTKTCSYCGAAKRLLAKRAVAYDEIDVTGDAEKRAWLVKATGRRTVPQIFVGGEPIGGYESLAALDRSGALTEMLDRAGSP
jgi:glutaredoxin 3